MQRVLVTATALCALIAFPAAAQNQTTVTVEREAKPRADQTEVSGARQQGMSDRARQCVERLEELDSQLMESRYGLAGPRGYGLYGERYGAAMPTEAREGAAPGAVGVTGAFGGRATPQGDMRALMRAGYIMAVQGYDQGCDAVVQTVQDIGSRYQQAIESGEFDREGLQRWRGEFLQAAVPVKELERPIRADEIIGADVQNLRDENLGDVEDVVLGPNGEIRYVIVSEGGFLGMGEDEIPVRWSDLRMTVEPYSDTFVLDIPEDVFDRAPRIQGREAARLATEEGAADIDRFWDETFTDDRG